eukprot:gene11306-15167_t
MLTLGLLVILALIVVPTGLIWILHPIVTLANNNSLKESESITLYSQARFNLSIVIPVFNEEERILPMLMETFDFMNVWSISKELNYEVIVVDDGSTDKTIEQVSNLDNEKIRIVKLRYNQGKGGALKSGIQLAKGQYILMVDGDGATKISDLDKLFSKIKSIEKIDGNSGKSVGVAIGSRAHLESESITKRAFYRTVLMRGFHLLVTVLCTKNIRDTQCGFKLFTHHAADLLFGNLHLLRWAFDIELIYLAEMLNIPMIEVAVNWHEVSGSKLIQTKLDVIKTSLTMARDMLCVRLAYLTNFWTVHDQQNLVSE